MIFQVFKDMLKEGDRIQFTIASKGNQLEVLVQPVFKGEWDESTQESIKSLKAALSMPLYVLTSPQELDADFPHSLAEFSDIKACCKTSLNEAMTRIKSADQEAKNGMDAKPEQPDVTTSIKDEKSLF